MTVASAVYTLPATASRESRLQFWRVTQVGWSPPAAAVYAQWPASSACRCRLLCLVHRHCAAAELAGEDGELSCRLASRRGNSTANTTAEAAFVRDGHAELGERCLSSAECWQADPGAACEAGVCACLSAQLTPAGRCAIRDCTEVTSLGAGASGQYEMLLAPGEAPVQVYCDMETAGGGWTVFQRRQDDPVQIDFSRDWQSYRDGFGNVSGQFWLGNELLHRLTAREPQQLRVDLEDFEGGRRFAQYGSFRVSDEADQYRLQLSGFSGDAGDSMAYQSGAQFSTRDRDNDEKLISCAQKHKGGWWYKACHFANLNGLYMRGATPERSGNVISWFHWKGHDYSMKGTEMKTRPARYTPT
ncbi:techylectin-5B-like [Pollicipes pollicipes]|uniref:techylectin-5B-like n=1 Tax=Pollicipes pollicipes TaxID=41117 RepID=UPI001884E612|nr:techylectin-5B-like [Pollicipes pollicipes]